MLLSLTICLSSKWLLQSQLPWIVSSFYPVSPLLHRVGGQADGSMIKSPCLVVVWLACLPSLWCSTSNWCRSGSMILWVIFSVLPCWELLLTVLWEVFFNSLWSNRWILPVYFEASRWIASYYHWGNKSLEPWPTYSSGTVFSWIWANSTNMGYVLVLPITAAPSLLICLFLFLTQALRSSRTIEFESFSPWQSVVHTNQSLYPRSSRIHRSAR